MALRNGAALEHEKACARHWLRNPTPNDRTCGSLAMLAHSLESAADFDAKDSGESIIEYGIGSSPRE